MKSVRPSVAKTFSPCKTEIKLVTWYTKLYHTSFGNGSFICVTIPLLVELISDNFDSDVEPSDRIGFIKVVMTSSTLRFLFSICRKYLQQQVYSNMRLGIQEHMVFKSVSIIQITFRPI